MDKQQRELEEELGKQATVEKTTDQNGLQAIKVTFEGGILFPTGKYTLSPQAQADLAGEEKELKHKEEDGQFYGNHKPQFPSYSHGTTAVDIRIRVRHKLEQLQLVRRRHLRSTSGHRRHSGVFHGSHFRCRDVLRLEQSLLRQRVSPVRT